MADEKYLEDSVVTFCVTVNLKRGNKKQAAVTNSIRKFSNTYTWYDVFDIATEAVPDDLLPKSCFDNFEKLSAISVSSRPSDCLVDKFTPNSYDKIFVLTDFDKSLKYVTIEIDVTKACSENEQSSSSTGSKNAFSILMQTSQKKRPPSKICVDKERFTGLFKPLEYLLFHNQLTKSFKKYPNDVRYSYTQSLLKYFIFNTVWCQ